MYGKKKKKKEERNKPTRTVRKPKKRNISMPKNMYGKSKSEK